MLTWYVRPPGDHGESGADERHPIDLVAKIGVVERTISLPAKAGALFPSDQSVCRVAARPDDAGATGLLAELTFSAGGQSGYIIDRESPTELAVVELVRADGDCRNDGGSDRSCVRETKRLGIIPIPRDLSVVEQVVLVEGPTRESRYRCGD